MRHAEIIASQATVEAMRHARPSLFHDAFVNRPEGILGDYIVKIFGPPFDFENVDPVMPGGRDRSSPGFSACPVTPNAGCAATPLLD